MFELTVSNRTRSLQLSVPTYRQW